MAQQYQTHPTQGQWPPSQQYMYAQQNGQAPVSAANPYPPGMVAASIASPSDTNPAPASPQHQSYPSPNGYAPTNGSTAQFQQQQATYLQHQSHAHLPQDATVQQVLSPQQIHAPQPQYPSHDASLPQQPYQAHQSVQQTPQITVQPSDSAHWEFPHTAPGPTTSSAVAAYGQKQPYRQPNIAQGQQIVYQNGTKPYHQQPGVMGTPQPAAQGTQATISQHMKTAGMWTEAMYKGLKDQFKNQMSTTLSQQKLPAVQPTQIPVAQQFGQQGQQQPYGYQQAQVQQYQQPVQLPMQHHQQPRLTTQQLQQPQVVQQYHATVQSPVAPHILYQPSGIPHAPLQGLHGQQHAQSTTSIHQQQIQRQKPPVQPQYLAQQHSQMIEQLEQPGVSQPQLQSQVQSVSYTQSQQHYVQSSVLPDNGLPPGVSVGYDRPVKTNQAPSPSSTASPAPAVSTVVESPHMSIRQQPSPDTISPLISYDSQPVGPFFPPNSPSNQQYTHPAMQPQSNASPLSAVQGMQGQTPVSITPLGQTVPRQGSIQSIQSGLSRAIVQSQPDNTERAAHTHPRTLSPAGFQNISGSYHQAGTPIHPQGMAPSVMQSGIAVAPLQQQRVDYTAAAAPPVSAPASTPTMPSGAAYAEKLGAGLGKATKATGKFFTSSTGKKVAMGAGAVLLAGFIGSEAIEAVGGMEGGLDGGSSGAETGDLGGGGGEASYGDASAGHEMTAEEYNSAMANAQMQADMALAHDASLTQMNNATNQAALNGGISFSMAAGNSYSTVDTSHLI